MLDAQAWSKAVLVFAYLKTAQHFGRFGLFRAVPSSKIIPTLALHQHAGPTAPR